MSALAETSTRSQAPVPCPRPARLLVVDDQPANRRALEGLLAPLSYEVHHAGDGAEALAEVSRLEPDLVLLDVLMPGMTGIRVARRSANRVVEMITDILDVARLESGRMPLYQSAVDVRDILQEVLWETHAVARKKDVWFDLAFDPEVPAAWADPSALRRV